MEAAELGAFMVVATLATALIEYRGSPVRHLVVDETARRALIGLAMGATAIGIVYSPWGRQSGAHFNPAVTLTFFRLGKVAPHDAAFYIIAQFAGAIAGVLLAALVLRDRIATPEVQYIVTVPGADGPLIALIAEVVISFILMMAVLIMTNTSGVARFTGVVVGVLVALFITVEAPLSGMSMNPARTVGSAVPARNATDLWVYLTAPPMGMFLAAEIYVRLLGRRVRSAKLRHDNSKRCIFRCDHHRGVPQ